MTPSVFLAIAALAASTAASADAQRSMAPPAQTPVPQLTVVRLHVGRIACDRCATRIRERLMSIEGVASVDVNREKKEVMIAFDAVRVSVDRLKSEIRQLGFDV